MKGRTSKVRGATRAALLAAGLASLLIVSACASDNGSTAPSGGGVSADGSLQINGEVIADKALMSAAKKEGSLTLYTTQSDVNQKAIDEVFTQDTGIKVEYFRDAGASLTARILSEAKGGVHKVDDVVLTSASDMRSLSDKSLLASYEPPTIGDHLTTDSTEIGADNTFYPQGIALYVIGVNKGVVGNTQVKTWDDILKPEFKGKLGLTPPGIGGSGIAVATFEHDVLGSDYWTRLGATKPVVFDSTVTLAQSLATGDLSVAIGSEASLLPAKAEGAPLELVYPDQGVPALVTYEAVAKQAPHPSAARVYHNWVLSKRGQEVQASKASTRSIRNDVDDPGMNPPRSKIKVWLAHLATRTPAENDKLIADWNAAVGFH